MDQQKDTRKPKWLRFFKLSNKKNAIGTTSLQDIMLYDFELTKNGALKKKSRDFLQRSIKNTS